MRGITRVVAPHHNRVVGVRPHHHHVASSRGQWQHPIVLEQHDTLAGHLQSQLLMSRRSNRALGQCCPGIYAVRVEVAQFETRYEQSAQTAVQVGLFDVAAPHRLGQVLVFRAALHIGASQHRLGRCFGAILSHMVPAGQKVAYGTAVAGDQSVESPFVAQYLLLVARLGATSLTVNALVGAHHLGHLSLLHQCLEGRQIRLPEVALRQVLNIKLMPVPLRSAVHGKVLGASQQLAVFRYAQIFALVAHALQSAHRSQSHAGRQVRVFTVSLLSASPARVAEDVDVWCPKRQTLVALDVARALGLLRFHPCLVAHGCKYLVQQGIVPRGSHGHGDGKHGGKAIAPHAVQRLVPPLELWDAQSGYGRRGVHHQTDLLVDGETLQQVVGTLCRTELCVLIG